MTEKLYKGRHIDSKKWVYGSYVQMTNDLNKTTCLFLNAEIRPLRSTDDHLLSYILPDRVNMNDTMMKALILVENHSVCGYTGELDQTGCKIFEKDIVQCDQYIGTIVFEKGEYRIRWEGDAAVRHDLAYWCHAANGIEGNCALKVIGNILDNPRMLVLTNNTPTLYRGKAIGEENNDWAYGYYAEQPDESADPMCHSYIITDIKKIQRKWQIEEPDEALLSTNWTEVDPHTVSAFTGRRDVRDKMIFEYDIAKSKNAIGLIQWDDTELMYMFVQFHMDGDELLTNKEPLYKYDNALEVIGNIHENFQLLNINLDKFLSVQFI